MTKAKFGSGLILMLAVLTSGPAARSQATFEQVSGKAFDSAVPKDFYLEGNAIPTEKRNAALLKTPAGARVLFALIDTSGYSSEVRKKYIGMAIAEGQVSICGNSLSVGSYGFGLDKPSPGSDLNAKFLLYNQAGQKVAECAAEKVSQLKQPRPLQVVVEMADSARLYLGRYGLELR